ncbi:MAG TPA: RluA family pseudouridine synthase [Anaerolineales bacterium]
MFDLDPLSWILWSDESLVVVNKPAGLPTLPDGYHPEAPHLKEIMQAALGPVWVAHRLDKETSGVLALARSAEAHRRLNTQFEQRQVSKVYHALIAGSPEWEEKTVRLPLRINVGHKHRTAVDPQRGKPAETDLHVLERLGEYALVEALPRTGRTHQIRAHLAALGCPILSDDLYGHPVSSKQAGPGDRQEDAGILIARLALHARSLAFAHPITGERLRFEAPYPADFDDALATLRNRLG